MIFVYFCPLSLLTFVKILFFFLHVSFLTIFYFTFLFYFDFSSYEQSTTHQYDESQIVTCTDSNVVRSHQHQNHIVCLVKCSSSFFCLTLTQSLILECHCLHSLEFIYLRFYLDIVYVFKYLSSFVSLFLAFTLTRTLSDTHYLSLSLSLSILQAGSVFLTFRQQTTAAISATGKSLEMKFIHLLFLNIMYLMY